MDAVAAPPRAKEVVPDSAQAWLRLAATVLVATVGGIGMWSVVVALPAVQADFGVARADASLPFTLTMVGVAVGGVIMGRLLDRAGILAALALGAVSLSVGYLGAAWAGSIIVFALAHALIGFGTSVTFGPMMADISHWFVRRRGVAVTLCAAGNYVAGAVWPPLVQHRHRPLRLARNARRHRTGLRPGDAADQCRGAAPASAYGGAQFRRRDTRRECRHRSIFPRARCRSCSPLASVCCCVAMSMPQVHIVAYCGDLGYGVARGADMLALMMAFGSSAASVRALLPTGSAACRR